MSGRAGDVRTREAQQSLNGLLCTVCSDFVFIIITLLVLFFICGNGSFTWNNDTQLSALHGVHALMMLALFIGTLLVPDVYMPILYGILAIVLLIVDVFVLIARVNVLVTVTDIGCPFMLLLTDLLFLLTAIAYLGFVARSVRYYTPYGESRDATDPLLPPRSNDGNSQPAYLNEDDTAQLRLKNEQREIERRRVATQSGNSTRSLDTLRF